MSDVASRSRRSVVTWGTPLAFVGVVLLVALVGAAFSADASSVYAGLDRPAWAPPGWLFGPAWTVLYAVIALSGWLAWRPAGQGRKGIPFTVYGVQLLLNAAWTPLFFGMGAFGLALLDILVLWVAILVTMLLFARRSRLAAALLLPYLGWVGYAAALNASFV